ncbi:MAG: hypothetical protein Q4F66_00495 [Clostridium sp.]|nr:hypothetical protein [Clostridium sp.]
MKNIKSFLGYALAALCIPIILAGFIGGSFWSDKLVEITDVTIAPRYTGGNVVKTISHEKYDTLIHRTVFDGLFSERKDGFVQIDYSPLDSLPDNIEEKIDYDNDGKNDFKVSINTSDCTAEIEPYNERVISLEGCYKLKGAIAVRVLLKNN